MSLPYSISIYDTNENNSCRYALGSEGNRTLHAIGLNPSTANDQKPDQTISKILGFAERNGFDSFLMLNLYPQRSVQPKNLHKRLVTKLHEQNLASIREHIHKPNSAILASWGVEIDARNYLLPCLKDIYRSLENKKANWLKIGDLTKSGHPRHPSRVGYALGLTEFDVENYITKHTRG